MEVQAAIDLERHLDKTGKHQVRTGYDRTGETVFRFGLFASHELAILGLVQIYTRFIKVYTKFTLGSITNPPHF